MLLGALFAGAMSGCSTSDSPRVATRTLSGMECVDGAVACGDSCARLASSALHCGACDNACGPDAICDRGACVSAAAGCSSGLTLCGGGCIDASTDREHCGGCEQSCAPEGECSAGSCLCPGELTPCDSACVDLGTDPAHCGACGVACVDSQACELGSCECPAGTELCEATCVDTQTSDAHCGVCGTACTGGQVCASGSCACPDDQTLCDEACADTQTSVDHCGACGTPCSGGQVCDAGSCACPEGMLLCDGQCIDTQSDNANCGGCGVACGLGEGCSSGACAGGALAEDGCEGLARELTITQVAAYQTVKTEIARDGVSVEARDIELVAGRSTLVRVFVAPGNERAPRELSARLHLDTGDAIVTHYAPKLSLTESSSEGDRDTTFEFVLPREEVTADARYAVEVVECETPLGEVLRPRFPETDGISLGALELGSLRIHVVPLRSNGRLPDTSDEGLETYGRAFLATFPIASVDFTVGEPVDIADPEDWNTTLDIVRALRASEAPDPEVYYYGMLRPSDTLRQFCGGGCTAGVGYVPNGRFSNPAVRAAVGLAFGNDDSAFTMLHEVAHNHGRGHSPCVQGGTITGVDQNYPHAGGVIGVYGYDPLGGELIAPGEATDLMGYCGNQWLSDYTYAGLIDTVMAVNQVQASVLVDPERVGAWRVMLVDSARGARWGRRITGPAVASGTEEAALVLDDSGTLLASVSVYRTEVADIEAFSIQVPEPQPGWHSIQVSGAPPLPYPAP